MEYLIVVMLVNALGQPVEIGTYNGARYPDLAACEAARPAIRELIQKDLDAHHPGDGYKVADSTCASKETIDKINGKIHSPPREGQKDASLH